MENYVRVDWPESQEWMDQKYYDEGVEFSQSCGTTVFVPEDLYNRVNKSNMRPIYEIAQEIRKDWGAKVSAYAQPYLEAMMCLDSIDDNYFFDSANSVVLHFLCNAGTWRGETAKRIKAELKDMLK